jgi:hypothetical protein
MYVVGVYGIYGFQLIEQNIYKFTNIYKLQVLRIQVYLSLRKKCKNAFCASFSSRAFGVSSPVGPNIEEHVSSSPRGSITCSREAGPVLPAVLPSPLAARVAKPAA